MMRAGHPFVAIAEDGVELHGEEHGAGPALVLLHGGGDRVAFRPLARRLAIRHRVLPPDIRFADTVTEHGLHTAWELFLPDLQPLIGAIVREAIPRADPASSAAAAAIGRDRAFVDVSDLAPIRCPVLVIAGDDPRHPGRLARRTVATLADGRLATATFGPHLRSVEELADAVAPEILQLTAGP